VSGGKNNHAYATHATVSGGENNIAGNQGTVGGGSTVSGGNGVLEYNALGWAGGGYHTP